MRSWICQNSACAGCGAEGLSYGAWPMLGRGKGEKMKYYRNASGDMAKLMQTAAAVVVMAGFRTMFFPNMEMARDYLTARGYY